MSGLSPATVATATPPTLAPPAPTPAPSAGVAARVLVVSASAARREELAGLLDALGHQAGATPSAAEALAAGDGAVWDLALVDATDGDVPVDATLARLREDARTRHVPLVVVAAPGGQASVLRYLDLGADDYLIAPVAPLLLEARVRACLTTARLREADRRGRLQLERELEIGREIQAGFLPETLPALPGYELATAFEGARQVSGDFYDAFAYDEGMYTGVVVGDVCGKGVGAALFMALFRTLIRAVATRELGAAQGTRPFEAGSARIAAALRTANDYIARVHGNAHMFATVFAAGLHPHTGKLWYVNAGHDPPLVLGADGGVRTRLAPTGPALGLLPELPFALGEERLQPGETLLVTTDGISEARDAAGGFFGDERLVALCAAPAGGAQALVTRVTDAVHAFAAGTEPADDLTLLALYRRPAPR